MPQRELFVPLPDSMKSAPVATTIRSTMLLVSRESLKERGHFAEYSRHLAADARAGLEHAVAGVWLPLALGDAHYSACDALGLGIAEQRELGGCTVHRLSEGTMGTMAKSLGSTGFVSLWDVLRRYHLFWERSFTGGGTRVWKVGPKDAILEACGLPLARIPYLRHAYGGLLNAGARFFFASSYVAEIPGMCTPTSLGYRVSWV